MNVHVPHPRFQELAGAFDDDNVPRKPGHRGAAERSDPIATPAEITGTQPAGDPEPPPPTTPI